jgi:hypothetical protein
MFSLIKNAFLNAKIWTKCCTILYDNFGIKADDCPDLKIVRSLWTKITSENKLSDEACIALFLRLIFLNYLTAYTLTYDKNSSIKNNESITKLMPLLEFSDNLEVFSMDIELLQKVSAKLKFSTAEMLAKIGLAPYENNNSLEDLHNEDDEDDEEDEEESKLYRWIRTEDGLIDMYQPNKLIFDFNFQVIVQPGNEGLLYRESTQGEIFIPANEIKDFWRY